MEAKNIQRILRRVKNCSPRLPSLQKKSIHLSEGESTKSSNFSKSSVFSRFESDAENHSPSANSVFSENYDLDSLRSDESTAEMKATGERSKSGQGEEIMKTEIQTVKKYIRGTKQLQSKETFLLPWFSHSGIQGKGVSFREKSFSSVELNRRGSGGSGVILFQSGRYIYPGLPNTVSDSFRISNWMGARSTVTSTESTERTESTEGTENVEASTEICTEPQTVSDMDKSFEETESCQDLPKVFAGQSFSEEIENQGILELGGEINRENLTLRTEPGISQEEGEEEGVGNGSHLVPLEKMEEEGNVMVVTTGNNECESYRSLNDVDPQLALEAFFAEVAGNFHMMSLESDENNLLLKPKSREVRIGDEYFDLGEMAGAAKIRRKSREVRLGEEFFDDAEVEGAKSVISLSKGFRRVKVGEEFYDAIEVNGAESVKRSGYRPCF